MPYYDYECQECGKIIEIFQHMDEEPRKLLHCIDIKGEDCPGRLMRKINIPSLRFVGSGFYVNDYKGK